MTSPSSGLLPDHEIMLRGREFIVPFDSRRVQPASYDLSLHDEALVPLLPRPMDLDHDGYADLIVLSGNQDQREVIPTSDGGVLHNEPDGGLNQDVAVLMNRRKPGGGRTFVELPDRVVDPGDGDPAAAQQIGEFRGAEARVADLDDVADRAPPKLLRQQRKKGGEIGGVEWCKRRELPEDRP